MSPAATAIDREAFRDETQHTGVEPHQPRGTLAAVPGEGRRRGRRVYEHRSGPWWSNLLYGLGTLAVFGLPPLIPGATVNGVIMGYLGVLLVGYGVICIWGMLRAVSRSDPAATRRKRDGF